MQNPPNTDDLWNYNKPKVTEKIFKELLENKDMNLHYILELKTQLARTQSLQRNFEEAHSILDSVMDGIYPDMIIVRIRYLLEKEHGEDFYAIDAAHMLAIVKDYPESIIWNEKAKKTAEKSNDDKARNWLGSLYNNIGWSYHDAGDYIEALKNFEKALQFRELANDLEKIFIAKWCIGRCLRSIGKIDEALQIQESIISEKEKRKIEPNGYVYEELAEINLLLNRKKESQIYFANAYQYLSKNTRMLTNEKARLDRILILSKDQ